MIEFDMQQARQKFLANIETAWKIVWESQALIAKSKELIQQRDRIV